MVSSGLTYTEAADIFGPKAQAQVMGVGSNAAMSYLAFLGVGGLVWHLLSDQDFSAILTLSVMVQALAFGLLALQVGRNRSAAGLSARTLTLYGAMLCLRLSSTLWLNGYLPVDSTGDHVYQVADIASLGLVGFLLHTVLVRHQVTYQREADSLGIRGLLAGCFVAAVLLHPSMNHYPLFDILWTTSLYVDALAMLPQLWLMAATKDRKVEGLTGHFIALMGFSRFLSGLFWYHGLEDVGDAATEGGQAVASFNASGWALVAAHVVMLALIGDFLFYYAKAVFARGGVFGASQMEVGSNVYDL